MLISWRLIHVSRFTVLDSQLDGVHVLERLPIGDDRGYLERMFADDELAGLGFSGPVRQINRTLTRQTGTVRGLHFQRQPFAEAKLITCLSGRVFDVAIDLRVGSPDFLNWFAVELDARERKSLLIPPGFGHGFQTLTDDAMLLYVHSAAHAPDVEGGLNVADRTAAIDWPLPIGTLSERDAGLPMSNDGFEGIVL